MKTVYIYRGSTWEQYYTYPNQQAAENAARLLTERGLLVYIGR